MKKVLHEGLIMKKREQFSDSAARFHNAPMHLQMATQTPNLMRLHFNKILNPDYTVQDLELKDQENKETASDLLLSEQHIYKDWDYRCLVPYSHKDSTKWKTYDMHEYRRAYNNETMKLVAQYKYDNNFYNWVDPKVLKYFAGTSEKGLKRAWRKTYGFPYITTGSWDGQCWRPLNLTKCFIKCAHYVREAPLNRNTCVVGGLVG